MNDYGEPDPAVHVAVDFSDTRVDALWSGVAARLEPAVGRRVSWRPWVLAGGLLATAGVVLVVLGIGRGTGGHRELATWQGAHLEASAEPVSVRLVDGSELKLDRSSSVEAQERTSSSVKLLLERGRLACDVTHRPGRSFVVMAAGVEVRVIGTRFSVAAEPGGGSARVQVSVERGVVEVRARAGAAPVRVEAGRSWSQDIRQPSVREEAASEPTVPAVHEAPLSPPAPTPQADAKAQPAAARARLAGGRPAAAKPSAVEGPRELFQQAREQWRRGHIQDAADTYQNLLAEFPRDGRAGLAAFELGRLRMDRLADPHGAARALERAVALAPGAEFREDAMARLVAAHAAAHDPGACVRIRDQYLVEFPHGVHRRTVVAACR